jgi:hypothetical protein
VRRPESKRSRLKLGTKDGKLLGVARAGRREEGKVGRQERVRMVVVALASADGRCILAQGGGTERWRLPRARVGRQQMVSAAGRMLLVQHGLNADGCSTSELQVCRHEGMHGVVTEVTHLAVRGRRRGRRRGWRAGQRQWLHRRQHTL